MGKLESQEKARAKRLWDYYGTTIEEWETVDKFQGRVCWLCGRPERTGKRLATDHSHLTGEYRGHLCSQCNPLIGKLENAFIRLGLHKEPGVTLIKIVERLALYLKSPPTFQALGKRVYGYAGRTGTKKHRKLLRKLRKATMPSPLLMDTKRAK